MILSLGIFNIAIFKYPIIQSNRSHLSGITGNMSVRILADPVSVMTSTYGAALGFNTEQLIVPGPPEVKPNADRYFSVNQSKIVFESTIDSSQFVRISASLSGWAKFIQGKTYGTNPVSVLS